MDYITAEMTPYFSLMFFLIGIVFGSFYNVVAYRLPNGMSLIKPGSHCPNCNHQLSWYELFPIFSFLLLGGKCKKCKEKISIYYPLFELLTGVLFSVSFLTFGFSLQLIYSLILCSTLVILVNSDIKYMIIPDELMLFSSIVIIFIRVIVDIESFLFYFQDGMILFVILLILKSICDYIFKKDTLGGGDIKLIGFLGLVLGFKLGLFTLFLSAFIALPVSLFVLMIKKEKMIPYGPFISVAALITFFYAEYFINLFNNIFFIK